jgi:hypothetical protein
VAIQESSIMIINIMLNAIHKEGNRYTSRALTPGLPRLLAAARGLAMTSRRKNGLSYNLIVPKKLK